MFRGVEKSVTGEQEMCTFSSMWSLWCSSWSIEDGGPAVTSCGCWRAAPGGLTFAAAKL